MTTWSEQTKNSTSFSAIAKSDVIDTMAGKVGYGAVGKAKVGATTDDFGITTSWDNIIKS